MNRGILTLAITGMVLALTIPAAGAGPLNGTVQLAQAQDDKGDKADTPRPRRQRMCDTAEERHKETLATAEAKLKLTEAQKPAWTKFAEAANAAHQSMFQAMCGDAKATPARTLPERLAREEAMAQARLSHLQAVGPSLLELYKALTPEQQKTADHLPLAGHGHDRRHHNGPHMGPGNGPGNGHGPDHAHGNGPNQQGQ